MKKTDSMAYLQYLEPEKLAREVNSILKGDVIITSKFSGVDMPTYFVRGIILGVVKSRIPVIKLEKIRKKGVVGECCWWKGMNEIIELLGREKKLIKKQKERRAKHE